MTNIAKSCKSTLTRLGLWQADSLLVQLCIFHGEKRIASLFVLDPSGTSRFTERCSDLNGQSLKKNVCNFFIHDSRCEGSIQCRIWEHAEKNVDAAISVVKAPVIGFRSLILVTTQGWHSTHIHWIINLQHPTHREKHGKKELPLIRSWTTTKHFKQKKSNFSSDVTWEPWRLMLPSPQLEEHSLQTDQSLQLQPERPRPVPKGSPKCSKDGLKVCLSGST